MDSTTDETLLWLIGDCFRNRLKLLIQVEPVLDYVKFIEPNQRDLILNKAKTECNQRAVDLLIDTIIKGPRPAGWIREFIDALEAAGCKHAAFYVDSEVLPQPSLEATNDDCVHLIDLLSPTLLNMKTPDVCLVGFALDILTVEDREIIMAETTNKGNINGARVLLKRIVQKPPGWFSTFLQVLRKTDHHLLVKELMGVDPSQDHEELAAEGNEEASMLKDETTLPENPDKLDMAADMLKDGATVTDNNIEQNEKTSSVDGGEGIQDLDLYSADVQAMDETQQDSLKQNSACEGKAGVTKDTHIVLRPYQMEVAQPALEGKNTIICLPTGSGKTRVAVYITKEHLDRRRRQKEHGKVAVLVNKVPLVEQHYSTEFGKFLKNQYNVERVSGDSQLKISFSEIVKKNDIIICTAQILENSFAKAQNGDDEGVNLSDFSLVVIDECHHTQKGEVYNHIMIRYLKQKHKNSQRIKEQRDPVAIPQILGLTASPGVGGAKSPQKAEEHILKICANLDAFKIMTADLGEHMKEPFKNIASIEERIEDPFGDVIKGIMNDIHAHADLNPACDPGTQSYEQWAVQKEQNAAKEENQKIRVCAEHLRQYNEALHQSNTIRMSDAYNFLNKFYDEEMKKKIAPEEVEAITITDTDRFLFRLFKDNKNKLQDLAKHPEYENKSLYQLRLTILQEFTKRDEARGIIFTRTRLSAIALNQWIQENKKFEEAGVRGSYLIGGGDQSVVKPMTSKEQNDVLRKFRTGEINLLIATTVAEEGLDIKESNIVIRYGLVTNEIAMIQARGRGRAEDSSYTLVEVAGLGVSERESVNEYREKMMGKAIQKVQKLNPDEYNKKKEEYQFQTIMEQKVQSKKKLKKVMKKEDPGKVKFACRNCSKPACSGKDVQIIANMHHVNLTDEFRKLFIVRKNTASQERLLDYEANDVIACKGCGHTWGSMMLHRGIDCPCLHIRSFVVNYGNEQNMYDTWGQLQIRFPPFDYANHANRFLKNSGSDED